MDLPYRINPVRYPTLYMYLVKLPHGLASYPEAQTAADLALQLRNRCPQLAHKGDLPAEVLAAIEAPWTTGEWVPEVTFMVLNALVRDVIYRNDAGYLQFCYDMAKESFSGKLVRAVMHFVSPSLLLMSAAKRWSLFKRGTELRTHKMTKGSLYASLDYPPNMYHKSMLEGFAWSFRAAIDNTRAKNAQVQVEQVSATESRYNMTWNFG